MEKQVRFDEQFITESGVTVNLHIGFDAEGVFSDDEKLVEMENKCSAFIDEIKDNYSKDAWFCRKYGGV